MKRTMRTPRKWLRVFAAAAASAALVIAGSPAPANAAEAKAAARIVITCHMALDAPVMIPGWLNLVVARAAIRCNVPVPLISLQLTIKRNGQVVQRTNPTVVVPNTLFANAEISSFCESGEFENEAYGTVVFPAGTNPQILDHTERSGGMSIDC
jgi:hypothetical protein